MNLYLENNILVFIVVVLVFVGSVGDGLGAFDGVMKVVVDGVVGMDDDGVDDVVVGADVDVVVGAGPIYGG